MYHGNINNYLHRLTALHTNAVYHSVAISAISRDLHSLSSCYRSLRYLSKKSTKCFHGIQQVVSYSILKTINGNDSLIKRNHSDKD